MRKIVLSLVAAATLSLGFVSSSHAQLTYRRAAEDIIAEQVEKAKQTLTKTKQSEDCRWHYFDGRMPEMTNDTGYQRYKTELFTSPKNQFLCYSQHSTMYNGFLRNPLYSAAYLTARRVADGKDDARSEDFREDMNAMSPRAKISDYKGSGYDRGHLVPSKDMPDAKSVSESFLLTNMVPQNPDNNRGVWAKTEIALRQYVMMGKAPEGVYVVTGGLYVTKMGEIGDGVVVPSHMFKAVYNVKQKAGAVYISTNDASGDIRQVSLSDFARDFGWDVFPTADKSKVLQLPNPTKSNK